MTVLPFLVFALAPATVTLKHEAAPVSRVLAALSKETGREYAVGPTPMGEIIFVQVKDAELDDLEARIAEATSGKWVESEGKRLLVPDAKRRRLEEQLDDSESRTLLGLTLKRLAARESENHEGAQGEIAIGGAFMGGMSDQLATRCALGIGLNGLSVVRRDGRVVWSTQPTAGQLQLRVPGLEQAVAKAVKEHNDMADAPWPIPEDAGEAEKIRALMDEMGAMFRPKRAEGKAVLVHAIGTREVNSYDSGLNLEVVVYNEKGERMTTSETRLGSRWEESEAEHEPMEEADVTEPTKEVAQELPPQQVVEERQPEPQWEFSERTQEWMRLVGNGGWELTKDERARELILGIAEHDPLSYSASEALGHYAERKGKNIVACLPDEDARFDEARTEALIEASWAKDGFLKMATVGDWLVVSPREPSTSRETQFDRAALVRLMKLAGAGGVAPLNDWADYAASNPDPNRNSIASGLVRLMLQRENGFFGQEDDWLVLRLYGTLSSAQRSSPNGIAVPAGVWSQTQRATVGKWVYGPDPHLVPKVDVPFIERILEEMPFGGWGRAVSLALEPTQVAPGWVGGNTALVVSRTTDSCYSPADGAGSGFPGSTGIEELALLQVLLSDNEARQAIEGEQPLPRSFRVGKRERIRLSIEVAPGVYVSGELFDDKIDPSAEPVALADLPPDQRARLDELANKMKSGPVGKFIKMMATMGGVRGRETVPPGD
ncbi:MAG: hypothetical protein IT207_02930 [Fimbriimonadaceae bacterium]|nr:hypothetical protein [Fimbriimonadaceae bacterium]